MRRDRFSGFVRPAKRKGKAVRGRATSVKVVYERLRSIRF